MAGSAVIGALRITLGINTAAFDKGLALAQRKLVSTGKDLDRIGKKMQGIGRSLSLSITAPVLAIGAGVLKLAGDFESAMNRVEAATGAAGKELNAMREAARAFGADPNFTATATEAAKVMFVLAKNGLSVTQILGGATEATLKLAAATDADFAQAGDLATDVMIQFGRSASEMNDIVDKITGGLIVSKFEFEEFKQGIGAVGGAAGALGVTFEDMNLAITATASFFDSGATAGTAFKTFLTRLVPQSKEAAAVMEQFGLEFFDASGKMKPLIEIAGMLDKQLGNLSDKAQADVLTKIFGTRGIMTAVGLMQQGADGIARIAAEVNKASAQTQMEALMKGWTGGLTQMKKAAVEAAIALGDTGFLHAAAGFIRSLADMVRWIALLPPGLLKFIGVLAGVAATIGPLLFVTGKLVSVWGGILTLNGRLGPAWAKVGQNIAAVTGRSVLLTAAFAKLRAAMAFLLSPWGIAILAIAAALYVLHKATHRVITADERLEKAANAAEKALAEQTEQTKKLEHATGEVRKAILAKARADLEGARAAMQHARALLLQTQAAAQAQAALAGKHREQARGLSAREGGAAGRQEAANREAQAAANLKEAIRGAKAANATVAQLLKIITSPAPKLGPDTINPEIGGGGEEKKKKERDDSEQRLKEMLRLRHDMQQEELSGQRELLQAQRDLTFDYQERADLARQMLDIEHQQRENDIAFDLAMVEADKTISEEQKAEARIRAEKARILNDQLLPLRKQLINDEEELERQRNRERLYELEEGIQLNLLRAQANLATTAAERRDIELAILDLAYREHRERLQRIIQESKDADERHRAEVELANLMRQFDADRRGVIASTRGPFEAWAASIPQTAAQISEALEGIRVGALEGLSNAIHDLIMGTKSLGDAFSDMARSIVSDIIQMTIRMLIFRAISGMFGGLGGGSAVPAGVPLNFGGPRAAGGPVLPGRTYLVGEKGPELVRMGAHGQVIPNKEINGGGMQIHVVPSKYFDVHVQQGAAQVVRAAAPQIVRSAASATARAISRPALMGRR